MQIQKKKLKIWLLLSYDANLNPSWEAPPAATQLDVWGMGFGKNFSYGMDDHTTYD